jgi:hypothetical protein
MIWQSTGLVVARASVQGLFAREAEFLRTPKTAEDAHWWDAIRGNPGETGLAVLGVAGMVGALIHASVYGGLLTAGLLLWPTIAYASAPANSLSAQRAALPPQLRTRRRTEYLRSGTARRVTLATAGLAAIGGAVAIAMALLGPGNAPVTSPQVVGPARGHPAHYGPAQDSGTKSAPRTRSSPSRSNSAPPSSTPPTSSANSSPQRSPTTPTPSATTTPTPTPSTSTPSSPSSTPTTPSPSSSSTSTSATP